MVVVLLRVNLELGSPLQSKQYLHYLVVPTMVSFRRVPNAGMLEHSSCSTLSYGIDDPSKARGCRTNTLDTGELCMDLYNGQKTIMVPLSTAIIATNFDEQELDRRVLLQCLKVYHNVIFSILYLYLGHCVYIDRLSLHGSEPITLHYIAAHIT